MPAAQLRVRALAAAPPATTIRDVIARMRALDAALPHDDGIACFNRLYLTVTETVSASMRPHTFNDPRFLARLDVVFANLYFAALLQAPKAWAPLVEARAQRGVVPLQFALAGMNAHINRDLPVALVATASELHVDLAHAGPQHRDYLAVNRLLAKAEERAKAELVKGVLALGEEALGRLDDRVAIWKVERARDAAWVQAQTLWELRALPPLRERYLATLDRIVGFAGRGLLTPII